MNETQRTVKNKLGRKKYDDPKMKKDSILLWSTIYDIELLGGKDEIRKKLMPVLNEMIEEKRKETINT